MTNDKNKTQTYVQDGAPIPEMLKKGAPIAPLQQKPQQQQGGNQQGSGGGNNGKTTK